MKKEKLVSFGHALGRSEMKKLMAGSGGSGNIYCSYNGHQRPCNKSTLGACTDWCVTAWGPYCGGCAQFPPL